MVEVRGGHAARDSEGRGVGQAVAAAMGCRGAGVGSGVSRWVVPRGRAVVTGEGAADGTGVLFRGCYRTTVGWFWSQVWYLLPQSYFIHTCPD